MSGSVISVRIQNLQWAGVAIAAGSCLLLGGWALLSNLDDYNRYSRGVRNAEHFYTAQVAANAISAERGPANSAMGANAGVADALSAALADKRLETDAALDALASNLAADSDEAEIADNLTALEQSLTEGRAAIDTVVATAPSQRNGSDTARAILSMFAVADEAARLRDDLGAIDMKLTPQIGTEIILSTAASDLREHEGRLGSYVVMMLTSTVADDGRYYEKFNETAIRLRGIWNTLDAADAYYSDERIGQLMHQIDSDFFGAAISYARKIARLEGPTNSMTAFDFTSRYVPMMATTEQLRERINLLSRRRLEQLRDEATSSMLLTALLAGTTVLVLVALGIALSRGLFRPLIAARRQIIAVAQGDLSEPPAMRRVSPEIQEMFDGLTILREQQREKLRLAGQLKTLSETDLLTGLPNRRALTDAAVQLFDMADRDRQTLAVVILDIDNFKTINDNFGHAIGDTVLQKIGKVLPPLLRSNDIIARYGGEEFVIILRDIDQAQTAVLCERLRATLSRTTIGPKSEQLVTGSFGVAMRVPGSGESWDSVIATADHRLYAAKRLGRNRVHLSDPVAPTVRAG